MGCFSEQFFLRKKNNPEMGLVGVVESRTGHYEYMFVFKQTEGKFVVMCPPELLNVNFWEQIQSSFRLNTCDTRNVSHHLVYKVSLFAESPIGAHHTDNVLLPTEG